MSKKTISIKEYADAKGVTTQSIYKNIKNENSFIMKYVVVTEEGKKELKADILNTIAEEEKEEIKTESATTETEKASSGKEENNFNNEYIDSLKIQIDFLKSELEKRDTQIEKLSKMLVQEQQLTLQAQQNVFLLSGGNATTEEEKNEIEIPVTGAKSQKKKSFFSFWHK